MIEGDDIRHFDPVRQSEIRATIEKLVERGYERKYHRLTHDGHVTVDEYAMYDDAEMNAYMNYVPDPD